MSLQALASMMRFVIFDEQDILGRGSSRTVFAGILRASYGPRKSWPNIEVAVKQTKMSLRDSKGDPAVLREVEILSMINHPACLSLIAFDMPSFGGSVLVTERMACDLHQIITQSMKGAGPAGWDDTAKSIVALGIAAGLNYLHSNNILHRDIKPSHILLDSNFYPRISGFGLAKILTPDHESTMTLGIGTPLFMAPELFQVDTDYRYQVDVYAYGMLLFILMTGSYPFPKSTHFELARQIVDGERPAIPEYVPRNYRDLITKCWSARPSDRPTFAQIIANPDALMIGTCDPSVFNAYKTDILKLT
jgi:serine/threonine protein kinase